MSEEKEGKRQETVTLKLEQSDLDVIEEYRTMIEQLFGVRLTVSKAARALLHQAAKAGAREMLKSGNAAGV